MIRIFPLFFALLFFPYSAFCTPKIGQHTKVENKSAILNEKGVQAVRSKNYPVAEAFFRSALAADPKNLTAVINLATVYITNKKEPQAIALLEQYANQDTKDPGIYARLGDAYFASKNTDAAAKNYEAALKLDPHYPTIPQRLSSVYTLQNKLDKAEQLMLVAVELNPKDGQLLSNLSSLFLANGKTDKAISSAKRALQVKANAETYITLGTAYEISKDYKNSLIAFEKAVELGDQSEELKKKIVGLRAAL